LLDYWPLNRVSRENLYNVKPLVIEKIPLFVLSLVVSLTTLWAQQSEGALKPLSSLPLNDRLSNAWVSILAYFGKFFYVSEIGIFYPFETFSPGVGVGAAFGVLAISYVFLIHLKRPNVIVGWLWFIIALIPVLGFVYVGGQSFADRWSYLPHIGFLIGACSYIEPKSQVTRTSRLALVCTCLYVALMAYKTHINLPFYKDSESVFRHTLSVTKSNFMAHNNLGVVLENQGRISDAAYHYSEAIRVKPSYSTAINNLGSVRAKQKSFPEAISLFSKALTLQPNSTRIRYNLGLAYSDSGKPISAAREWVQILALDSKDQQARKSLNSLFTPLRGQNCLVIRRRFSDLSEISSLRQVTNQLRAKEGDSELVQTLFLVVECLGGSPRAR
ncbi:MAG: tetratricopeptide repeat protein, partial [Bdellovibrionales bacterium]|nr:tetratricopeptide repeat protein [Bdellovibrionales bacterium]